MATEFDDSTDYSFFIRNSKTLTNGNGYAVRWSEIALAALRAQGVFDNMEDGTTAPAHDKLWLDKNSDPAVLKEWDSVGSSWVAMTFDRLFGRATVTDLTNVGGTANAITADEPSPFMDGKIYGLVPTAGNTGAATLQIAGVGTYDIVYPNGDDIAEGELAANLRTPLLFANGRFEIIFGSNAGSIKRAETDASAFGFVIDEDDMASGSATKVPTQQSVKAYVGDTVQAYAGPSETWNSATEYTAGDKVSYNGAIYQANADNTNKEPGVATEWDEFIPPFVGGTLTDQLVLAASTASRAGLVLTAGTAPTSPAEGEIWRIGTAVAIRMSGGTYIIPATALANEWAAAQKFSGQVRYKTGTLALTDGINVGPTLPTEPFVRITGPTAAFSIASLTGVYQGQRVTLYNTTTQTMTIKHQDSTNEATSAFKRIICPGAVDITGTLVVLHYDETAARWVVESYW